MRREKRLTRKERRALASTDHALDLVDDALDARFAGGGVTRASCDAGNSALLDLLRRAETRGVHSLDPYERALLAATIEIQRMTSAQCALCDAELVPAKSKRTIFAVPVEAGIAITVRFYCARCSAGVQRSRGAA